MKTTTTTTVNAGPFLRDSIAGILKDNTAIEHLHARFGHDAAERILEDLARELTEFGLLPASVAIIATRRKVLGLNSELAYLAEFSEHSYRGKSGPDCYGKIARHQGKTYSSWDEMITAEHVGLGLVPDLGDRSV